MSELLDKIWKEIDISRGRGQMTHDAILNQLKSHVNEISYQEHQELIEHLSKLGRGYTELIVPNTVVYSMKAILKDKEIKSLCDPWAKSGLLVHQIAAKYKPSDIYAITQNASEAELGNTLVPEAHWENAHPLKAKVLQEHDFDVIASIIPFGVRIREKLALNDVEIEGELDSQILCAYSLRLKDNGVGLFVVSPGFFFRKSAYQILNKLGLCVDAAFDLPAGTFTPLTSIPSNLIVVKKGINEQLFAGKLSNNNKLNKQVIDNYLNGKVSKNIDFGSYVDAESFRGMEALRAEKEFERLKQAYEGEYYTLEEITESIVLGKHADGFEFSDVENAIYIPLVGKSDVVGTVGDMRLKSQNYAQLKIKQGIVNSEFVIRYLNSAVGVETRIMNMSGAVIQRLNKSSLMSIGVFVPKMDMQQSIIETSHEIRSQKNKLTSLISELNEYEQKLWKDPGQLANLKTEVSSFQAQVSPGTSARSEQSLKEWIEILPYPLASILRAWYATSENDPKTKYEHLLHFFEAFSLFAGLIFLSAFRSNQSVYEEYKDGLAKVFAKNPIHHASFGTWKSMVEYFSKHTREKLKKDEDKLVIEELFYDSSLALPVKLSDVKLLEVITETNKYRNQWTAHGGVVGKEDATKRNEILVESLNKLRSLMGDLWEETELLTCESMKKKGEEYKNEVLVLMGSNSEFKSETRSMAMPLDEDILYLHSKRNTQSLPLLPLIRMGSPPSSVKNACYFYNRISGEHEARFVSYHYADMPEIVDEHDEIIEVIKSLSELGNVQ